MPAGLFAVAGHFYKASIAVTYGGHDAALEAFNAAEKYSGGDKYFACQIHPERGKVYVKTGDFDAAIGEAGGVIKPGTPVACEAAYVPRADAHFAEERWAETAAEDERARRGDEYILGEIQMPDGVAFDKERVDVVLVDPADGKVDLWFMTGDDRRSIARYKRARTFGIIVDYEDVQGGKRVRLTGSGGTLTVNGTVGPITIKLQHVGPKG